MKPSRISDLYRHMEWADSVVWREALADPAIAADVQVRELLHHIHLVQWAFSQVWRGEELSIREVETFSGPGEVLEWARRYYALVPDLLALLDSESSERPLRLPWADELVETYGEARPVSLEETMIQVVLHSTHHRAQLNARLRELGREPRLIDYVAWLWMGRPEPIWDEIEPG